LHSDLLSWRKEFPILGNAVYLINNSLGAMPQGTARALGEFTDTWRTRGVRAWKDSWWQLPEKLGDQLAGLIGARQGVVSIQPNVTSAQWVAYSCLKPTKERRKVIYGQFNFPSVRYFYQAQPELEIKVVSSPDGITIPTERMLDAIDETTLIVPISHVLYHSSYIQDVEAIIEKAHRKGACVVLDLYHSCGVVPVDVRRLQVDFAVGGVLKWLCGGPGVAFLYVRPDLLSGFEPRLVGWMAHRNPFRFEPEMDWTDSAYRFQSGTPNIPGLHCAREGLRIIQEIGVKRIRERSISLTEYTVELARENGFHILSPGNPERRGGHVAVDFPRSETILQALLERDFLVDYRPGSGIRIAPHFFNTKEEIESLFIEIRKLLQ
jgi:kynureninase